MFNLNVLGLSRFEGSAEVLRAGGRQHHQHWFGCDLAEPADSRASIRRQRRGGFDYAVLAKELGPKKIRVNSINPGMVETEGRACGRLYRKRLREVGRVADAARPYRTDGGYRAGCDVPCVG